MKMAERMVRRPRRRLVFVLLGRARTAAGDRSRGDPAGRCRDRSPGWSRSAIWSVPRGDARGSAARLLAFRTSRTASSSSTRPPSASTRRFNSRISSRETARGSESIRSASASPFRGGSRPGVAAARNGRGQGADHPRGRRLRELEPPNRASSSPERPARGCVHGDHEPVEAEDAEVSRRPAFLRAERGRRRTRTRPTGGSSSAVADLQLIEQPASKPSPASQAATASGSPPSRSIQ